MMARKLGEPFELETSNLARRCKIPYIHDDQI